MKPPQVLIIVLLAVTLVAYGFSGQESRPVPSTGLWRPFFGLEHLFAAIGIGAWVTILRGHAFWALPAAFLAGAALGYALAWDGRELKFAGLGLMLSVLALAFAVLLPIRMQPEMAAIFAALFGIYHGYAYGWETMIIKAVQEAG